MNYIHESVFVILYEVVGMFSFKLNGKTVMVDGLSTMFWHNLLRNIEYSEWLSQCVTATLFMCPMVTSCVILLLYKILQQHCILVSWKIVYGSQGLCLSTWNIIYEFLECQSDNNSSYYNVRLDTMCQTSEDFNSRHMSIVFIGAKVSYPCWCCL